MILDYDHKTFIEPATGFYPLNEAFKWVLGVLGCFWVLSLFTNIKLVIYGFL
jgi:hypothetical protein